MRNGLTIQWGHITTSSSGGATIQFWTDFTNSNYVLTYTPTYANSPLSRGWGIKTGYTKSQAVIQFDQSYALECLWIAIGY